MEFYSVLETLGVAILGSLGTIFTLRFTRKKMANEAEGLNIHNMKEIISSWKELKDEYKSTIEQLTERTEMLEKRLEELMVELENIKRQNREYEMKNNLLNKIISSANTCLGDKAKCPVLNLKRENVL